VVRRGGGGPSHRSFPSVGSRRAWTDFGGATLVRAPKGRAARTSEPKAASIKSEPKGRAARTSEPKAASIKSEPIADKRAL
jgi:hypothetical protein